MILLNLFTGEVMAQLKDLFAAYGVFNSQKGKFKSLLPPNPFCP
jgi:hypothetical protein